MQRLGHGWPHAFRRALRPHDRRRDDLQPRLAGRRAALESSALGRAAQEAVDEAAATGADVAVAVGRELLQHDSRWHHHPAAVDQRPPAAIVLEIGAGRPTVAFDAVHGAVAARVTCAGLLQFFIPIVMLGVALAMLPLPGVISGYLIVHSQSNCSAYR